MTSTRTIDRIDGDERVRLSDAVVCEAPLEIRIGALSLAVLLRTPGHDADLVRGFLLTEGGVDIADITGVVTREAATAFGDIAEVTTPRDAQTIRDRLGRSTVALSACGMCGKESLADIHPVAAIRAEPATTAAVIARLPERLRQAQAVFAQTGGLHAAGLFDTAGKLWAVREDVGRHNAVDKVIGALAPFPGDAILCVSGRIGFEIAYKAAAAGIAIIVAVSAPSALAIDFAERHRITLCGFVRGHRQNIYSHPHRIT